LPYRQNFPIPAVIDPPKTCLQIEIPDHPDWKAVISGVLFELSYWFNWERTGDTSGAQCAAVWKEVYNSIDWGDMSCCCENPALTYRINPETGQLEQSSNGGVTWTPAAGGLQSVIVQPVPPVTSGVAATKCDAATNVAGQVQVWIDQVSTDFETAVTLLEFATAVLTAILAAVLTILSAGTLTAVEALVLPTIAAALTAAWGAGKVVFDAYWTTENKDKILCAAFCNIGDDGSFNDAQSSAFWNECNSELPPSPAKMLFMAFLSSVGKPGLNAMAASGMAADSDCADCACSDVVRIYVEPGGGTEVSWDFETGVLIADAEYDGVSAYNVYLAFDPIVLTPGTPAGANYCGRCSITVLSGAGGYYTFIPCGTTTEIPIGITDPAASSWNTWILRGASPFQVQANGAVRT